MLLFFIITIVMLALKKNYVDEARIYYLEQTSMHSTAYYAGAYACRHAYCTCSTPWQMARVKRISRGRIDRRTPKEREHRVRGKGEAEEEQEEDVQNQRIYCYGLAGFKDCNIPD